MKKFFFFLVYINICLSGQSYWQEIRSSDDSHSKKLNPNYEDSSFMPLYIGNQYQYIKGLSANNVVSYSLRYGTVIKDTQIVNQNYSLFTFAYSNYWFRYSDIEKKLYKWHNEEDMLYMDFNKAPGDTFTHLTYPATILSGDTILFSTNYPYRGYDFTSGSGGNSKEHFAKGLGLFNSSYRYFSPPVSHSYSIALIMAILYDSLGNIYYFTNHNKPNITITPITLISTSNFKLNFTVTHQYNRIVPPGHQSLIFLDTVKFNSYYSKEDSIIKMPTLNLNYSTTYAVNINLDTALMKNGFIFNYRIIAKDKGIIPETSYAPDSGYYQCVWDFSTSVDQETQSISEFALHQNYPNPFNPTTKISWLSPIGGTQTLKIFDVLGREVLTLFDEWKEAGSYNAELRIENGELPSGVYFYRIITKDFVKTMKMILMK